MKKSLFVISLLSTLSVYGCTLDAPLELGEKCSDETHGVSVVVYSGNSCVLEDLKGESKEKCRQFADSFRYGYCPINYYCIKDKERGNVCSMTRCLPTQHEHNGQCEENTLLHCGQHGYECEINTSGWLDGTCEADVIEGAKCVASRCEEGYLLNEISGLCEALIECEEGEHLYMGICEPDSVENCGRHGYACAARTAGWVDGTCEEAVCRPSACDSGYKLEHETCKSLIDCDDSEHIYQGECEPDGILNCGHHGNDCRQNVGWEDGNCVEGRCFATVCMPHYDLVNETGVCRYHVPECGMDEHIYEENCETDDVNHCGMHGYSCQDRMVGWVDGECKDKQCVATSCETGYNIVDGKCKANFECTDPNQHYYNGICNDNDIDNCGRHNYACASNVMGWKAGACVEGICVASACATGYDVEEGRCIAKTSCTNPDTHYYNGACIANDLDNCGNHNYRCASMTGWQDGSCVEGVCLPSSCAVGYHLNDEETQCVADDAENCGSVGNACGIGEVCTAGECSDNCGVGEVRCEKDGIVACADPNTNTTFCGADDTCSAYNTCGEGQACVNGACVQNSCSGNTTLCSVNGENQCIALSGNNANHCGACNLKCADLKVVHATSNTCKSGKCQYSCEVGYTNCGTATMPECINTDYLKNDPNHCGTCNMQCEADEYCNNGKCMKSTCTTNACLVDSVCKNLPNQCGTQCVNCNTANNAAAGTCSLGVCTITQCAEGYHLSTDKKKCEANTPNLCGSVTASTTTDCTKTNHATDGYCQNNGTCYYTACAVGYHAENGKCVVDTPSACGAGKVNCTGLAGWKDGKCDGGVCKATSCKSNYCLSGTTCVDGTYNSKACGVSGGACTSCNTNYACVSGSCKLSACNSTTCFWQGTSCNNSAEHCGKDCINCNYAGHAAAGKCSSGGTCSITECAIGYHLSSGKCVANTSTACAGVTSSATKNCNTVNHAASGVCQLDGTCLATSCQAGYHLKNGTCVANTDSACGEKEAICDTYNHFACDTNAGVCTCASGYAQEGAICVIDNLDADCDANGYAMIPGTTMKAYCIKSKEDFLTMRDKLKSVDTWPSDNEKKAYYLTRDIDLGTQSSWTPINAINVYGFVGNGYTISGNLNCSGVCSLFGSRGNTISSGQFYDINLNLNVHGTGNSSALFQSFAYSSIKNINMHGTVVSDNGSAGCIGISFTYGGYTNGEIQCDVTGVNGVGGVFAEANPSGITNVQFRGNVRGTTNVGGLVGTSAQHTIKRSFVEGNVTATGSDGRVGGIVGAMISNTQSGIISSYYYGTVTGAKDVGGLIGIAEKNDSGMSYVQESGVFGFVKGTSTSSSNVGGLFGSGYVDVKESFTVADISNAMNAAQIGTFTGETFTATTVYSAGLFTNVTQKSDDILFSGKTANEKLVLSYSNTGNGKFKHYYTFNSSNVPAYNSKSLFTALNEAAGSTVWEQRTCTITTGPAKGTTKQVSLAIPKALGEISICSW